MKFCHGAMRKRVFFKKSLLLFQELQLGGLA